jgi:integrase
VTIQAEAVDRAYVHLGQLLEVIRRRAAVRRLDCPLVFHRDGRPLRDFRTSWVNGCERAGLPPGLLFHDLRRSAIRNMVRARVPGGEKTVMAISGHKTRSVFDRYNITAEDDIAEAIELTAADVARKRDRARHVELLPKKADTTRTLAGPTG